jgi:hypothetical protein
MELIFPFRNITINTLWDFFEKSTVKDYSDYKTGKLFFENDYFNSLIENWRNRLPNFENEILQIINTTDQKTIDEYFNSLRDQLYSIKDILRKDFLTNKINEWNEEILKKYSETVEKEGEEYSKQVNRKKDHLEEYEDWDISDSLFSPFGTKTKKTKKINYNFYCIEKTPDLIDINIVDEYYALIKSLYLELFSISKKYGEPWSEGKLKSKIEEQLTPKPIVFVEGEHDITYITKAGELLNKNELLEKVELRQRGGFRNLDKLWNLLKEESWETVSQIKIFLYDCDTNKTNEDFGKQFKRIIPSNPDSIIKKGIENLISNELIQKAIEEKKAFVDFKKTIGTKRGIDFEEILNEINKDEKKNFCDWICKNCKKEDFQSFKIIFEIIEEII